MAFYGPLPVPRWAPRAAALCSAPSSTSSPRPANGKGNGLTSSGAFVLFRNRQRPGPAEAFGELKLIESEDKLSVKSAESIEFVAAGPRSLGIIFPPAAPSGAACLPSATSIELDGPVVIWGRRQQGGPKSLARRLPSWLAGRHRADEGGRNIGAGNNNNDSSNNNSGHQAMTGPPT